MTDKTPVSMPAELTAIVECGYAIWATDGVDETMRARFDSERIPVAGVCRLTTSVSFQASSEPRYLTRNSGRSILRP